MGIIAVGKERVHGLVHLVPVGDRHFASDPEREGQGLASDMVIGVGVASRTLADLTIRKPVELALDLGTGCGFRRCSSPHARRA